MSKYDKLLSVAKEIVYNFRHGYVKMEPGSVLAMDLKAAIQECEEDKQLPEWVVVKVVSEAEFKAIAPNDNCPSKLNEAYILLRDLEVISWGFSNMYMQHDVYTFSEWQSMQKGGEGNTMSGIVEIKTPEISKRERFAAMALQGILASGKLDPNNEDVEYASKIAVFASDSLIKQLSIPSEK